MDVLIACEKSDRVRAAFEERGHNAWSCDLLENERERERERERRNRHIRCDVLELLDYGWDMMIAFPPCTYICSSGLHWNKRVPGRAALTKKGVEFALALWNARIPKIGMENPIGCLSTEIRKPDQIIQPYQFGDDAAKSTCLWLKGLPLLRPTLYVPPRIVVVNGKPMQRWANQTDSGQNRLGPSPTRAEDRARTYEGIARAMAEQWG